MSETNPVATAMDLSTRTIAYFSMEIALAPKIPTYSGGLGVLAGDTLRSAADTGAPMVAVSLCHRKGYFEQHLDGEGRQTETDVTWSPESLPAAGEMLSFTMQGRAIKVCAWRFDVVGVAGHVIPVFLLDTDIDGNDPYDRLADRSTCTAAIPTIGCARRRCWGIGGGQAAVQARLRCRTVYHMNEGHAALLALGLLQDKVDARLEAGCVAGERPRRKTDRAAVAKQCVFTTHTPVPAGHDQFGPDQMYAVLGDDRAMAIAALRLHA